MRYGPSYKPLYKYPDVATSVADGYRETKVDLDNPPASHEYLVVPFVLCVNDGRDTPKTTPQAYILKDNECESYETVDPIENKVTHLPTKNKHINKE